VGSSTRSSSAASAAASIALDSGRVAST
jgi:hypothetical protein